MRLHEIRVADASRFEHRRHCKAKATGSVDSRREGRMEGIPPRRRRTAPPDHRPGAARGPHMGGLRRAMDASTEGRRVLRAVVSRRSPMRI
ncbi:hypothetical protein [Streptomyces sp. NPDC002346]